MEKLRNPTLSHWRCQGIQGALGGNFHFLFVTQKLNPKTPYTLFSHPISHLGDSQTIFLYFEIATLPPNSSRYFLWIAHLRSLVLKGSIVLHPFKTIVPPSFFTWTSIWWVIFQFFFSFCVRHSPFWHIVAKKSSMMVGVALVPLSIKSMVRYWKPKWYNWNHGNELALYSMLSNAKVLNCSYIYDIPSLSFEYTLMFEFLALNENQGFYEYKYNLWSKARCISRPSSKRRLK